MRAEKKSIVREIKDRVSRSEFVFMVDHTGLDAGRMAELRGKLAAAGAEVHVISNRLFKIVADELGWKGILKGPSAAITGINEVNTAKALKGFRSTDSKPALKAGVAKGAFLTAGDIDAIAELPTREVMLATFLGMLVAPASRLVGAMNQKLLSLVYVLKAVEGKKA